MTEFYTYLHCKPDGTPFYVGKGSGRRAYDFSSKRNQHHKNIIVKYKAENVLVFVFNCDSEQQALVDEVQQIAQLRHYGYDLCNKTDGGEGVSGLKHSEASRKKMSLSGTGHKHTQETKEKISATQKGRIFTPETRAKISISKIGNKNMLGYKHTKEARDKLSKALLGKNKGKIRSPEFCARVGRAGIGNKYALGFKHSPETRAKMSVAQKGNKNAVGSKSRLGQKHSEAVRAKISKARRACYG